MCEVVRGPRKLCEMRYRMWKPLEASGLNWCYGTLTKLISKIGCTLVRGTFGINLTK